MQFFQWCFEFSTKSRSLYKSGWCFLDGVDGRDEGCEDDLMMEDSESASTLEYEWFGVVYVVLWLLL